MNSVQVENMLREHENLLTQVVAMVKKHAETIATLESKLAQNVPNSETKPVVPAQNEEHKS